MKKPFDYLIFIGRFQPFHRGHFKVAKEAFKYTDNLIFVMGSHMKARSTRNPFTTREREAIIRAGCAGIGINTVSDRQIHFAPQFDYTYNDDRWIAAVQASVFAIVHRKFTPDSINIGIIGYDKDHTTYYLKKFPQWELLEIPPDDDYCATEFRRRWYSGKLTKDDFISEHHEKIFHEYTDHVQGQMAGEYHFINLYRNQWANSPYPPTFVTVDAVVAQSGHLLLVERKEKPGQGLWALPGGFVNQNETLEGAVLRELYEETRLKVPKPVLKGSLVSSRTFDDPHRSERGRTITEAFHFKLRDDEELPKVKGSDDAAKAFWIPYSEVVAKRDRFFEDHYAIIEKMVGL